MNEYAAIRRSLALSIDADPLLLDLDATAGLDLLHDRVATNLSIREATYRQALILDDEGRPIVDLLVGFFRGRMHVVAWAHSREEACAALGVTQADVVDDHVLIGIDGPFAWETLGAWDTASAIGLPYLGCYSPDDELQVIRAGKTGEYGYLLRVPRSRQDEVWNALQNLGQGPTPVVVSADALADCAFENWVFDIDRLGGAGLDALELQLTWRLDLNKQARGLDAVRAHRAAGLRRRITALKTTVDAPAGAEVVTRDGLRVGEVVRSAPARSHTVAVLDMPWAHAGLDFVVAGQGAVSASAPFLLNHSLFVNPQRHTWDARQEVPLPDGMSWDDLTPSS